MKIWHCGCLDCTDNPETCPHPFRCRHTNTLTLAPDKFRLLFPDGNWFQDEDGNTEFSRRKAEYFKSRLAEYVTLDIRSV